MSVETDAPRRSEARFGVYSISIDYGVSNTAIFSFSSLDVNAASSPHPEHRRDWAKTMALTNASDFRIYIQDDRASWYSCKTGLHELILFIEQFCDANEISSRIAIGLSMGGTGALLFDNYLLFDRVIAFSPQTGIGLSGQWDGRYSQVWKSAGLLDGDEIRFSLRESGEYLLFAALDVHEDLRHAFMLSSKTSSVHTFLCRSSEHNLGNFMKQKGIQRQLVAQLLSKAEHFACEKFHFKEISHRGVPILNRFLQAQSENQQIGSATDAYHYNPALVPTFMFSFYIEGRVLDLLKRDPVQLRDIRAVRFPLALGQSVRAEELDRYAVFGWHHREDNFVWSNGTHHIISFEIIDWFPGVRSRIRIGLFPFVDANHKQQRLEVTLNGSFLRTVQLSFEAGKDAYFLFDAELTERENEIVLYTPDCASPRDRGLGEDTRVIAVNLFHLSLDHANI